MKHFIGKKRQLLLMGLVLLVVCPLLLLAQKNDAEHPLAQKVKAYRQAIADHDTARVQAMLAKGAARWYEKKEGPGTLVKPAGKGPWSDWDAYFMRILRENLRSRATKLTASK